MNKILCYKGLLLTPDFSHLGLITLTLGKLNSYYSKANYSTFPYNSSIIVLVTLSSLDDLRFQ
uniref:Uncharacterized protein n=1 Tax=Rhizophora mucronata TaxID=61149 RepID=A0A2P2NQJ1_RHIMU